MSKGSGRDPLAITHNRAAINFGKAIPGLHACWRGDQVDVRHILVPRTGWDPRDEDVPHVYLIATPTSMQAWNSLAEIDGRTIMRNGQWTAV